MSLPVRIVAEACATDGTGLISAEEVVACMPAISGVELGAMPGEAPSFAAWFSEEQTRYWTGLDAWIRPRRNGRFCLRYRFRRRDLFGNRRILQPADIVKRIGENEIRARGSRSCART